MEKELQLFKGYDYPMSVYGGNHQRGGFTQLSLDLSSRCNYLCDWCFNKDLLGKDSSDLLSLVEKKTLLDESIEMGVKTLVIPGTGEPTLDSDFYPLIEHAHGLGLTTVIYSNLTGNLDKEKIEYLFSRDVSIGVKLDALHLGYFTRRYHANENMFKKFSENLGLVISTYKGSEESTPQGEVHRIIANMVLTHDNKDDLPDIARLCKNRDMPLFVRPVKPVTWAGNNPELWKQIGNRTGEHVFDSELVKLSQGYNTLFSPSSTLENHCALYAFGLTIKNNGDIQFCPDHHESRGNYGNIRDVDLMNVMERLNSIRTIKPGFCVMLPEVEHD